MQHYDPTTLKKKKLYVRNILREYLGKGDNRSDVWVHLENTENLVSEYTMWFSYSVCVNEP